LQPLSKLIIWRKGKAMKNKILSAMLMGAVLSLTAPALTAQTFSQDMKHAGDNTKHAAKDTGEGVKTGSKKAWHETDKHSRKAWHSTKKGTKKAWDKTESGTRKTLHKGAHETDKGAKSVEHKME
jgi:type II secretory pathway pseudopilin PulG